MKFTNCKVVMSNIIYLQSITNTDNRKMAKCMGISLATFQNRKNKPQTTTLAEIERICDTFHIGMENLLKPLLQTTNDKEK